MLLYNYVHIKIRINVFVYVQFLGNKKCRPSQEGDLRWTKEKGCRLNRHPL